MGKLQVIQTQNSNDMNTIVHKCFKYAFVVSTMIFVITLACQKSWSLRVRVNLLLSGHVIYELHEPGAANDYAHQLDAIKLVFSHGECVGYLNRSGGFVPSLARDNGLAAQTRGVAVLVYLQLVTAGYSLGYVLWCLIRVRNARNRHRSQPHQGSCKPTL